MPLVAQYKTKKWFTQYKNGPNLDQNLTDFTTNLRANHLEKVKLLAELLIYQAIPLTDYFVAFNSGVGAGFSIKSTSTDFSELSIGDEITIVWQAGNELNGTITSLDSDLVFCDNSSGNPLPDGDGFGNGISHTGEDFIIVRNQIDYIKYKWGFSDNNGNSTTSSRLDGRTNVYELNNISNSQQDAVRSVLNANDETLRVKRLPNTFIPENKYLVSKNFAQQFEIEHTFIFDDYNESDISSIEEGKVPTRFIGEACQNYYSELEFRNIESAPETAKLFTYEDASDTGYLKEKFNQGVNPFVVSNVVVKRISNNPDLNGNVLDNISSVVPVNVSFRVESDENVFGGGLNYHMLHKTLHAGDIYEFSDDDYVDLFDYQNIVNDNLNTANGTIITNLLASNATDFAADFSFDIYIDKNYSDVKYLSAILIGDIRNDNLSRKAVVLPVISGIYFNTFDIEGLIENASIGLSNRGCENFYTSNKSIKAELMNTKLNFDLVDGEIVGLKIASVANRQGVDYLYDTFNINFSSQEISGVQRINENLQDPYGKNQVLSFNYISGNSYEALSLYRIPFNPEKKSEVDFPSDVYDENEPHNGFNKDSARLADLGFSISVGYLITVLKDGINTDYLYKSFPFRDVNNYEETL